MALLTSSRTRRRIAALLAITCVAAGIAVAPGFANKPARMLGTRSSSRTRVSAAPGIAAVLSREFFLFRMGVGTPAAGSALHWGRQSPAYSLIVSGTRSPLARRLMLDPRATMAVQVAHRVLWVEPGLNGACVSVLGELDLQPRLSGVCGPLRGIARHGLVGIIEGRGNVETLYGLVSDGNTTVTVVHASGARQTVAVRFNTFVVTAHGQFRAIDLRRLDGRRVVSVLPALAPL